MAKPPKYHWSALNQGFNRTGDCLCWKQNNIITVSGHKFLLSTISSDHFKNSYSTIILIEKRNFDKDMLC